MDGSGRKRVGRFLLAAVAAGVLSSCSRERPAGTLPEPGETLAAAGKRLSQVYSAGDLTSLASRGERVLAALTALERDALARGDLRFNVRGSVVVDVAAPRGSKPFWLDDLGFEATGVSLRDERVVWDLHRKSFPPGAVGLGVNGLGADSPAHYAVFVRRADGGAPEVENLRGDGWEASAARDGLSLERQGGRVVEGLPRFLANSVVIRRPHGLRNANRLASGRVWKTHVVSSKTPDQVVVSFGGDGGRTLSVSWRTSPGVETTLLRLRRAGDVGGGREVRGQSERVTTPDVLNDPVVRRHTVWLDGLEPGTAYEYAVGSETKWAAVRTAPEAPADVSFLYMGDPQCGLEGWGKLLAAATRHRPDASALLIAGDLVDRGNERTNWDHFFLRAGDVFGRLPLLPAVGNHEYLDRGPRLYRGFFALPENGPDRFASDLVYHFEAGDAFVAVLDSTSAVSDPASARAQAEWLDAALAATRRRWKLVMFHHPVYASHPTRESPVLRDAWVPVFDRHGVDLVLQGHDHAYLRTYPLRGGRRSELGTVYVVSVSGDKYYEQRPAETTEVGFTHVSTYQTIDLRSSENRLVYRSFDAEGRERDGFTVERSAVATGRLAGAR